jgi:hypothetical protein
MMKITEFKINYKDDEWKEQLWETIFDIGSMRSHLFRGRYIYIYIFFLKKKH